MLLYRDEEIEPGKNRTKKHSDGEQYQGHKSSENQRADIVHKAPSRRLSGVSIDIVTVGGGGSAGGEGRTRVDSSRIQSLTRVRENLELST